MEPRLLFPRLNMVAGNVVSTGLEDIMKNNIPRLVLALIIALGACSGAFAAAEFPFNGGFELLNMGEPVGWVVEGPWLCRTEAATAGRNGLCLRADMSEAGNRLSTEGYLLAGPGETLKLSLMYNSVGGGPSIGLIFGDAFGRPVGEATLECLTPAATWTPLEREITLTADACKVPYSSVRPFLVVDQTGVQAKLDCLKITRVSPACPAPLVPKFKAEDRPNLLPNAALKMSPDGMLSGWTALAAEGFAAEQATVTPVPQTQTARLNLLGGPQQAAWTSDPVLLDGALPYAINAGVCSAALTAGKASLVLRVTDPQDPSLVWLQRSVEIEPAQDQATYPLSLPRLALSSIPVKAQLSLVLDSMAEGCVVADAMSLQPEPLSMAVRSVSMSGGFQKPKDVSLFISAVNNTYASLKPKAYMKVTKGDGTQAAYEARAIVIGSRSAAYFPYKPQLAGAGDYKLLVRIVGSNGKELGNCEYNFSVAGS